MSTLHTIKSKVRYWIKDIYKIGFYHILSVNVLTTLFSFASQVFVVWALTSEEIGQIRVMQSFLAYAILIGSLGFQNSTLKLCSENRPQGEIVYLYRKSLVYSIWVALGTMTVFILLNQFGLLVQNTSFRNPFLFWLVSLIPLVLYTIDTAYLQSAREFQKLARIQVITKIITVILIVGLTYLKGIYGFVAANVVGNIISSAMMMIASTRLNHGITVIPVEKPFKLHFNYSGFAFLSNLTYQASLYLDMVLLNYLVKDDLKAIGSYGFATLVISFFGMITISFQQVLSPILSNASDNIEEWSKIHKKYNRIYLIGLTILGIVGMATVPFLLVLAFGSKFAHLGLYFSILWISWYIRGLYSFQSTALFGLGKFRVIFNSSFLMVLIGLPLNYLLTKNYSVIGTGIANCLTSLLGLLIYSIAFSAVFKKVTQSTIQGKNFVDPKS